MNKFKDFDQIKTPPAWIEEVTSNNFMPNNKKKIIKIKYTFTIILIIMLIGISSIGITYAFFDSFRAWLDERFGTNLKITSTIDKESSVLELEHKRWLVENEFIGIVDEDYNYLKVYILENNQLIECLIQEYYGQINNSDYAFKYAIYQDKIIAFDYRGCVTKVLPAFINNEIYVCTDIRNEEVVELNIARINLETREENFITNDNISVNSIGSPQYSNILINKSDQGWENYNIETGKTNVVKNIDPFQHDNCITFIDEQTVITYDENGDAITVNILTDEVKKLDKYPLEGTIINIEYNDNQVKLTNIITNESSQIDYYFYGSNYLGTYCNMNFIVLFDKEILYIYDVKNNQIINLNSRKELDEQLSEVRIIDQKHLLITTDKRVYIVDNEINKR